MSGNSEVISAPGPRRFPLRGIERFGVSVDGISIKCNHTFLVSGDVDTLVQFLPVAVMNTFNRHPRMRAQVVKDELFTGEVQPPVTLDGVAERNLLRVREFTDCEEDAEEWKNWTKFVEEECHIGFDRYTQFMFYLTVWVNKAEGQARLMLFSDHIMSDGDSGMVAVNDILEQVAQLSQQTPEEIEEYPLRPSLYDMWFSSSWWLKPVAKAMLALVGRSAFVNATKTFKSVLPAREDQKDFCVLLERNSTHFLSAEGDPTCMRQTLARCKEMGVSFTGALIPMIVLAFYHARKTARPELADSDELFRLGTEVNYNMRKRVASPAEETQVGLYVTISNLPFLATEGVDMKNTKFWDLARRSRQEMVGLGDQQLAMALPVFMMDRKLHKETLTSFLGDHRIANSLSSDTNISSVGRYPFKMEHTLASDCGLRIENMHTFASVPFVASSATLWVSSMRGFNYSIGHKVEDNVGAGLLNALVSICEAAGSIGADETLLDVLKRLEL